MEDDIEQYFIHSSALGVIIELWILFNKGMANIRLDIWHICVTGPCDRICLTWDVSLLAKKILCHIYISDFNTSWRASEVLFYVYSEAKLRW